MSQRNKKNNSSTIYCLKTLLWRSILIMETRGIKYTRMRLVYIRLYSQFIKVFSFIFVAKGTVFSSYVLKGWSNQGWQRRDWIRCFRGFTKIVAGITGTRYLNDEKRKPDFAGWRGGIVCAPWNLFRLWYISEYNFKRTRLYFL